MIQTADDVGPRLKALRLRSGLSLRQLAERADVTAGMVSCIERSKSSPSIALLQKVLRALGTDLATFFSDAEDSTPGPVYRRENMRLIRDPERHYALLFPKRDGIGVEMLDETLYPGERQPELECLTTDVAGYVIAGELALEIAGEEAEIVRAGDAFYIPQGTTHRGYAMGDVPVRLLTVIHPARY